LRDSGCQRIVPRRRGFLDEAVMQELGKTFVLSGCHGQPKVGRVVSNREERTVKLALDRGTR